jgi:hypothetical protein
VGLTTLPPSCADCLEIWKSHLPETLLGCLWAGIATRYGLEGPGIEFRWGEIFRTYRDRLWVPTSFLYNGYWVFTRSKGGRGVTLKTHPLWCGGHERVQLDLYSPSGDRVACYRVKPYLTLLQTDGAICLRLPGSEPELCDSESEVLLIFVVVPCILIILKFLSPTNAHFIKHIKC